jgi:hypothetical protein
MYFNVSSIRAEQGVGGAGYSLASKKAGDSVAAAPTPGMRRLGGIVTDIWTMGSPVEG